MMNRRAFLAAIASAAVAPALPAPARPVLGPAAGPSQSVITIYALLSSGERIREIKPAHLNTHVTAEARRAIADGHVLQFFIVGPTEVRAR